MISTNGHRRSEPVRVGVVGLGYWGPNLVRVLHDLECADVAAVCDVDTTQLEKIARRYPAVERTTAFSELIRSTSIDAVAIATPIGTHFELARAALEAGKHVFVEKPVAGSVAVFVAGVAADDLLARGGAEDGVDITACHDQLGAQHD